MGDGEKREAGSGSEKREALDALYKKDADQTLPASSLEIL